MTDPQNQEKDYLVIEGEKIEAVIIKKDNTMTTSPENASETKTADNKTTETKSVDNKTVETKAPETISVYSSEHEGELAEWTTAYINSLPDSSFAVVESCASERKDARHLPFKDAGGKIDLNHLQNAGARMNQIKSVCGGSDEELRAKAKAKLEPLLKKHFPTSKMSDETLSQNEGSSNSDKPQGDIKMAEDELSKKITEGLEAIKKLVDTKITEMDAKFTDVNARIEKLAKAGEPAPKAANLSDNKPEKTTDEKLAELREKMFKRKEPRVKVTEVGPDDHGNMRYIDA